MITGMAPVSGSCALPGPVPSGSWSSTSAARCGRTPPGKAATCPDRCHRGTASAPTRPGATPSRATRPSTRRPPAGTVRSWAEQTAPDFRFILKLPKSITHERRLADVDDPLRAFLGAIEPLGARAHALWIQLPPSFGPGRPRRSGRFPAPPPARVPVLRRGPAPRVLRRPAIGAAARAGLGDVGAEWATFDTTVLFESPPASDAEREAWRKKPRLPRRSRALTAHPVVRYIGRDDAARTVAGWQPWLDTVAGWLREGRSPTVFIHTPETSTRSSWPAGSTATCGPGCPSSGRCRSRSRPAATLF